MITSCDQDTPTDRATLNVLNVDDQFAFLERLQARRLEMVERVTRMRTKSVKTRSDFLLEQFAKEDKLFNKAALKVDEALAKMEKSMLALQKIVMCINNGEDTDD